MTIKGRILKIEAISKKFHNIFRFTRRTAEVIVGRKAKHSFVRHVLETGPAVSILPYFYYPYQKKCYVVLVRQYRPAVKEISLEAPGGLLKKGANVSREMARELFEEAGINVSPRTIRVIDTHHLASSFCDQIVHLGIVELKPKNVKEFITGLSKHNGLKSEKEFTEVVVLPLERTIAKKSPVKYTLAKYQLLDLAHRLRIK